MEQLTCELNGIKYLLMERFIDSNSKMQRLRSISYRLECIEQGVTADDGGMFGVGHMIIKVLVPEKNVIQFNKEI